MYDWNQGYAVLQFNVSNAYSDPHNYLRLQLSALTPTQAEISLLYHIPNILYAKITNILY